jgi:hypothetical protein
MELEPKPDLAVGPRLVEAITSFPLRREVVHCGTTFSVSPFDLYAECPSCHARIKLRAFSGCSELEDVFDAVFEWMNQDGAKELVHRRQEAILADRD